MPAQPHWASIFRASEGPDSLGAGAVEAAVNAYIEVARTAWPTFEIDDEEFVRYVAARTSPGKLPDAAHAADLLLACACARSVPAAIEAFRQRHGSVIARVLSRRRASADLADDAAQTLYERLLVAPAGATPKIGEYKGTGPLRSWVSTAAATTAMMMQRTAGRRREQPPDSKGDFAFAADANPELLYMKERYKTEMEDAVARALDRLNDRERTILRLHLGERMTIDQLGVMYRVNRATAARWLAAARESVIAGARDELRTRLRLSPTEWDSIVALVQSGLHVSIARRLK